MDTIRDVIRDRGLKQNWIAQKLGISQAHFCEMLLGRKRFPIEAVQPLAAILSVSSDAVLGGMPRRERRAVRRILEAGVRREAKREGKA